MLNDRIRLIELRTNKLLNALPFPELENIDRALELVVMSRGMVLCEASLSCTHAYFPTSSVISLSQDTPMGEKAQIAIIGREGVVGISAFMGGDSTSSGAEVICAGLGYRIESQALQDAFNRTDQVRKPLLRYTQALFAQMAQAAICNRYHLVENQLSSLLLHCVDRFNSSSIFITQERMAEMLGVQREGVTRAALKLQESGYIRYARGHIDILKRTGLEKHACECYRVVKTEYDRLLAHPVEAAEQPISSKPNALSRDASPV